MSMNQTSNEELLQLAIKAARRRDKENAKMLLTTVYQRDRRNESALLWLAKIASTRQERIGWLEKVLEINPENDTAKSALEKLQYRQAADENRTLVLFGGIAALMIILVLALLLVVLL